MNTLQPNPTNKLNSRALYISTPIFIQPHNRITMSTKLFRRISRIAFTALLLFLLASLKSSGQTLTPIKYGRLYNFYAVTDTSGLAPEGWHIPTDAEWTILTNYLGGSSIAGGKLKETGLMNWNSPNTGATNETGFTALPGGSKDDGGEYYNMKSYGIYWSSTLAYNNYSWARYMNYNASNIYRNYYDKRWGLSIRCIKDDTTNTGTVVDIDGNVYPTVKIGSVVWMARNLATTKFKDGTPIPEVNDWLEWNGLSTVARCNYLNDENNVFLTPTLTISPKNITVLEGSMAIFMASSANATSYIWETRVDSNSCWNEINGATQASYTIQSTSNNMNNYQFRCTAINEYGSSNPSNAATLKVIPHTAITPIKYGYLYNCYVAADAGGLVETDMALFGWKIPNRDDIFTLSSYVDVTSTNTMFMSTFAGGRLKERGTEYWNDVNDVLEPNYNLNLRGNGYRSYVTGAFGGLKNTSTTYFIGLIEGNTTYFNVFYAGSATNVYLFTSSHSNHFNFGVAIRLLRLATEAEQLLADGTYVEPYIGNDLKTYRTVKIGTQVWLADNLAETKYRNGDTIPNVTDNSAWAALTTGARCAYNNDESNVSLPPTFTLQPKKIAVWKDSTATFTISAQGATSYRWEVSTNGGSNWSEISGATDTSYTTSATTIGMNSYQYRCKAYNSAGLSTNSNAAILKVITSSSFTPIKYGYLYNWYAVNDSRLIAPAGWHIPTYSEWVTLSNTLGGNAVSDHKLKEAGTLHWNMDSGSTNESGFTAIPGGYRFENGGFNSSRTNGLYWTSNNIERPNAECFTTQDGGIGMQEFPRNQGNSIRCIKDDTTNSGFVIDIDENVYPTVKIGNQVWMARNLVVSHYNDSSSIPDVQNTTSWTALNASATGARCAYNNDESYAVLKTPVISIQPQDATVLEGSSATFKVSSSYATNYKWEISTNNGQTWTEITEGVELVWVSQTTNDGVYTIPVTADSMNNYLYRCTAINEYIPSSLSDSAKLTVIPLSSVSPIKNGYLYNSNVISDSRGIVTSGWRVSTFLDWITLRNYLSSEVAGDKIKETGFDYWNGPDSSATNEAMFNARGGGQRSGTNGVFSNLMELGIFQTSNTGNSASVAFDSEQITMGGSNEKDGLSIRLVKMSTPLKNGQSNIYTGNDGKIYRTICIGTQEWLADNLAETQYLNHDPIPNVTQDSIWTSLTTGARCAYNNNECNVLIISPGIIKQPDDVFSCEGNAVSFTVVPEGSGLQYQWKKKSFSENDWTPITNANQSTFTIGTTTAEMNRYLYACDITSSCGVTRTSRGAMLHLILGNNTYSGTNTQPKNWTETIVYNGNDSIVAHSRSYADWLGRGIQSQSANLTSGRTIISQVIYDDLGRQAITTLPAAVVNPNLSFKPNFITNASGGDYTSANFDGTKVNTPDPVNAIIPEALGWYYNMNNNAEPYVAESQYPYARVEYSNITGQAKRSAAAGEAFRMGSGHEIYGFSMPAPFAELGSFPSGITNFPTQAITKSISVDVDGKQVVAFTDAGGSTIAAGRVGGGTNAHVVGTLPKDPGYLDVHIASGCEGSLSLPSGYTYTITNLLTDSVVTSITPGFYRIQTTTTQDLSIDYDVNYSDLSFNSYDQSGRLKESYSPLAVTTANHSLKTTYKYNTLGWLLESTDSEQGLSQFVYRKDGSIRFSQNAKQQPNGYFSYTNYDESNRPIQSGEYRNAGVTFSPTMNPETILTASYCHDTTGTKYDLPDDLSTVISNYNQSFTVGRVSKTWNKNCTTWYSYTYDGRVEWVVRKITAMDPITINYTYDFNGNVTKVEYQRENNAERLDHRYTYDADLRLSEVSTKTHSPTVDSTLQAKYTYYAHGPLKRVEYGGNLQGVDYTYTLNGSLKAINDPLLSDVDPGQDGYAGRDSTFSKDLFGMALDYYHGDYMHNGVCVNSTTTSADNLFNGNIKDQRWRTRHANIAPANEYLSWIYKYTYDSRNYLAAADFGSHNNASGVITSSNAFGENGLTYDPNGNLTTLTRYGNGENGMDNLSYTYSNSAKPNQLTSVADGSTDNTTSALPSGSTTYTYNAIGQMVSKTENSITEYYKYNPYGLVEGIYADSTSTTPKVIFAYDDNGFRVWKKDYVSTNQPETFYIRDASGNILAIYERNNSSPLTQFELPIYGSGRIGTLARSALHTTYELTDHLGNVRTLFGKATNGTAQLEGYTDYYPYGMEIPGRKFLLGNRYRFGYQGQFAEKDEETGLDHFEARDWDSRIGRWLSFDPAGQFWSPYVGMGNNPVSGVDPDGCYSEFWAKVAKWVFGADRYELTGESKDNYAIVWKNGGGEGINAYRSHGWAPRGFAMGGSTGGSSFSWMPLTTPSPQQKNMYFFDDQTQKILLTTAEVMIAAEGIAVAAAEGVTYLTGKFAAKTVQQGFKSLGSAARGFSKNIIPKGFKEVKQFNYPHGQKVYKYMGKYYSRDIDGHNTSRGWKVFELIGGKLKRIGTADETLTVFKK